MRKLLSLVVAIAAACGAPAPRPASPAPAVALGELALVDVGKQQGIAIHADGTVEQHGVKLGKVTADGKLVTLDTGAVIVALAADGTVVGRDGASVGSRIADDGTLTTGTHTITIDATGELVGGEPGAPRLQVQGATSAGLKRTALLVLVAVLTAQQPDRKSVV